ncbi:MAG: enolase C-terminal domain-like protein [Balneolaceae bacterium]|nr:enolase C-terminal domain-like protein [Balneolaceae bacterium]
MIPNRYDQYNWTANQAEIDRMYNQMAAAREQVGPDVDICADMHGRYDLPTGKKVAQRLEPLNLMWLEEPIPAENPEAYKLINESSSAPICAGKIITWPMISGSCLRSGRWTWSCRTCRSAGDSERASA